MMNSVWKVVGVLVASSWTVLLACDDALGQTSPFPDRPGVTSSRDHWEQQSLRRSNTPDLIWRQKPARRLAGGWSPVRSEASLPVRTVSALAEAEMIDPGPVVDTGEPLLGETERVFEPDLDPLSMGGDYIDLGISDGCSEGCCNDSPLCDDCCTGWGCQRCSGAGVWSLLRRVSRRASFFLGTHGFKGPADLGRNGNFGLDVGVNLGGPLGDPWGMGYQLGMLAVGSNFSGDQTTTTARNDERNQVFFTGGIFRRQMFRGVQWGVAYDLLRDDYFGDVTLHQIRTETALVLRGTREIGFVGAFGTNREQFPEIPALNMRPTDTYSLFYRRRFSGGGQGRIFAGFSGQGDAVLGGDATVPLGTSWSLQNNFTYLAPKHGSTTGGQLEESWAVSIRLVWYPGRSSRCVFRNPFHPLFNVADNAHFLLDRR
ncbi:MAG: DUF6666 family protein [Planctomycetota bacterium]|jgi:hypothetical protein